ncbi:hypothetical protein P691DRAFT_779540 [Macrolepiota fuliginosa MF-IS2]|uniref:DUF6533 domain-containing protein n=1 Tax=Macrolepiota fuliginosa MF-IS2 TaxID=1400762 RepID=A0A9P6BY54_9AGAR|nr:hypothetical protein P691DRAFT_779540 [Macrolepiota fuliginosa MF-IS2]
MNPTTDQLVESLRQIRLYQYVDGIAVAIYVYDYLLTFSDEVELVWGSRWTVMKTAFLLDRYLFAPNLIIQQFLLGTLTSGGPLDCTGLAQAYTYLSLFGVYFSGTILCIRLWVMWDKNKKFLAVLCGIMLGTAVYHYYDDASAFKTHQFILDNLHTSQGCVFGVSRQQVHLSYVITLAIDFVMLVLSLVPSIRVFRSTPPQRHSLMYQVYREGVLFYVYLCAYSILCVILVIENKNNGYLLVPVFVVIRMVLSTRMVLHTRRLYRVEAPSTLHYSSNDQTLAERISRFVVAPNDEAGVSRVCSSGDCR